jgi:hypothetical protein
MTKMTEAEFDALTARNKIPFTAETRAELYAAFGKLEVMIDMVGQPKPREAEPALIFLAGKPA